MTTDNTAVAPATNGQKKQLRLRSVAYPSFTLESALKMSTKINIEFTSLRFIPIEDISKFLNVRGGTFLMQMSSCVQYGLLQLKKGEGYKPTPLLNSILKPLPTENVNDLLLDCLKKPELYQKLFNDYKDKQLPSESGLANTLDRLYGVKGNGAITAAKVFFKNIKAANLVSNSNELKIGSFIPFLEIKDEEIDENPGMGNEKENFTPPAHIPPKNNPLPAIKNPPNDTETGRQIPIFLSGGREARVVLPLDFNDEDLKKIVKVLNAYVS